MKQFVRGFSVILAYYPDKPSRAEQKKMRRFVRALFWITRTPALSRMGSSMVRSQEFLTKWLFRETAISLWFEASNYLHSPRKWGPVMWQFLHRLSHKYTVAKGRAFFEILSALPTLLPCPDCGRSFRKILRKYHIYERPQAHQAYNRAQFVNLLKVIHTDVTNHIEADSAKKRKSKA